MDMEKEYTKAKNKYCNICNQFISLKDIQEKKIIMAITKHKHCAMVHKTCLVRR